MKFMDVRMRRRCFINSGISSAFSMGECVESEVASVVVVVSEVRDSWLSFVDGAESWDSIGTDCEGCSVVGSLVVVSSRLRVITGAWSA